jgi:hypothetical protein
LKIKVKARGKGIFVEREITQAGGIKINYPPGSRYEIWLEVLQVNEESETVIGKMMEGKKMRIPLACIRDFMGSGDFCQYEAKAGENLDDLAGANTGDKSIKFTDMR